MEGQSTQVEGYKGFGFSQMLGVQIFRVWKVQEIPARVGQSSPQLTTNGKGAWHGQPIEWRQRRGGWLRLLRAAGRWPPRRRGSSLFLLPAEPGRAQPRAQSGPAERSRTRPSPAEPRSRTAAAARAPPCEQASGHGRGGGAAPGGGGARSPQTARGRGRPGRAAAGAAGGGCAAAGEGRGRGRHPCPPPAAPRPQAPEPQSAPSIPLPRIFPRARTGLNSGSGLQVDISTARESLSVWTGQPPRKAGYTESCLGMGLDIEAAPRSVLV